MSLNNYDLEGKKTFHMHPYNIVSLQSYANIYNRVDRFFFYLSKTEFVHRHFCIGCELASNEGGPLGLQTISLQLS